MIKRYFLMLGLTASFFLNQSSAQEFPYSFSVDHGEYVPLTDGANLVQGMYWDDPELSIPLDFQFKIFGQTVTQLNMFEFVGAILTGTEGENDFNGPAIIAYGSDIIDRGELSGPPASPIVYHVEGNPGSQVIKIEWQNAGFYNEIANFGTSESFINFQVWLAEGSNDILIHIGPNMVATDQDLHDGGNGPLIGLIDTVDANQESVKNFWYLSGDPSEPELELIAGEVQQLPTELIDDPAEGTIYLFSTGMVASRNTAKTLPTKLFPTLSAGPVTVEVRSPDFSQPFHYELFDDQGRLIRQMTVGATDRLEVDLSSVDSGVYIIRLTNGDRTSSHMVIRE